MVDWVKRVVKSQGDVLHPGEEVVSAVFSQAAGGVARQVTGGAIGGIIGAVAAEKVARKRAGAHGGADEGGIAATFPRGNSVIALTPHRLIVFGHSQLSGKPRDPQAEYPLSDLHEITLDKRKLSWQMLLQFADNTVVDRDIPRMGGAPEEFKATFDRLKGR